jgi:hypothetical protein
MKLRFLSACAVAACVLWVGGASAAAQESQPAKQAEQPKLSGDERKAAEKITKAKGPEARLQAAAEFVQKFPQSTLRPQVVEGLAAEIANTQDAQLRTSLAETYAAIFTGPGEAERLTPILLDTYVKAGRAEDAFRLGSQWLAKNPDDAHTLYSLAIVASNEAIKGNNAYAAQGRQYGARAAELIEADKMPAGGDAAKWAAFKTEALPTVYRATGIIALKNNDRAAARQLLEKAIAHKSTDPGVFLVIADLLNQDYELTAKQYTVAAAGEKEALRKKADEQLDRVIESYAQAIAVSEGNPQYQPAATALRENLTTYYKYRHNSTDGMQQLIDKYKKK